MLDIEKKCKVCGKVIEGGKYEGEFIEGEDVIHERLEYYHIECIGKRRVRHADST